MTSNPDPKNPASSSRKGEKRSADLHNQALKPQQACKPSSEPERELTPQAKRALSEAQARRESSERDSNTKPEVGGRDGPDPVRYGDWEKDGIISDF